MPEQTTGPIRRPLAVVTAGHVDHGKTTLVKELTGTDTDRLEEERRRGISIQLGFADMELPGGRSLSIVDVPGHHRLVRAMVAGAGGVDLFLLVIAADDGVMPQTREHWTVLRSLGITRGVIAISKVDLVDEDTRVLAAAEAKELAPGIPVVEVGGDPARLVDLRGALAAVASELEREDDENHGWPPTAPVLHLDRAFSLHGIGTVVTGTLRGGRLHAEQRVRIIPSHRVTRIRSVQVHGRARRFAVAGERVALNLAGVALDEISSGDVIVEEGAVLEPCFRLDAELDFEPEHLTGARVQVHHGTREAPGRLVSIGGRLAQLRLESPLIAAPLDRFVLRRIAPPETIGGGAVVIAAPRRHGDEGPGAEDLRSAVGGDPESVLRRALAAAHDGIPERPADWSTTPLLAFPLARFPCERWQHAIDVLEHAGEVVRSAGELRLAAPVSPPPADPPPLPDRRARLILGLLDADGLQPRGAAAIAAELSASRAEIDHALDELTAAGLTVRLRGEIFYPAGRLEGIVAKVTEVARARGSVSLAEVRDDLMVSRKYAQAVVEYMDARKLTVRHGDRHQLRRPDGAR